MVKGIHPKILRYSAYKYSTYMSKVQKMRLAIQLPAEIKKRRQTSVRKNFLFQIKSGIGIVLSHEL